MGWTYTDLYGEKVVDYMQRNYDNRLLAASVVKRTTAYAAYKTSGGQVIGIVWLIRFIPKAQHSFGYIDMDESCGPYQYDCPIHILNMLTPLDSGEEYARNWRANCWLNVMSKRTKTSGDIDKDFKYLTKGLTDLDQKDWIIPAMVSHLESLGYEKDAVFKKLAEVYGFALLDKM